MKFFEFGLVLDDRWHMLYGMNHGFGYRWMPDFIQRAICTFWNHIACAIVEHEFFAGRCSHCSEIDPDWTAEHEIAFREDMNKAWDGHTYDCDLCGATGCGMDHDCIKE